jgi:deoxyribonucleoside regulator
MKPEKFERDIQFRSLSAEQREQMMVQAAKRFYQLDMTMGDLSDELGLTRWQASKLLAEARETGVVRIEIVPHAPRLPALESELQRKYQLKEAIVVPAHSGEDDALMLDGVARAAAQFIAGLGRVPLIGVSWGRTMSAVARRLPPFWNDGVEVVLLNGAMTVRASGDMPNNVAELFARSGNGVATLLPVPAILGHAATRVALEQDPTIASVLDLAKRAPVICFGIGAISPESVLVTSGYLSPQEAEALIAKGAVGDILSRYINDRGEIVDPEIDSRTIGLDLAFCRNRELSIAVGSGRAKHAAILACLKARHINVLVTDEQAARFLMEEAVK